MEESGTFHIDTKGICLMCLRDCYLYDYNYGPGQTRIKKEIGSCTRSISFKMLLRYLKINLFKLCHFPPAFLESMDAREDADIVISLCAECSMLTEAFSRLYENMEDIRLQLDACVQTVYEVMRDGGSQEDRVEEYQRRRRSKSMLEMMTANVAEQLRIETMRKCSLKVDALIPRVTMYKRDSANLLNQLGPKCKMNDNFHLKQLLTRPQPKLEHYPDDTNLFNRLANQDQTRAVATKKGRSRRQRKVPNYSEDSNLIEISEVVSSAAAEELVVKVEPIIASMSQQFHDEQDPLGEMEGDGEMMMTSEGDVMVQHNGLEQHNDSNDMTSTKPSSNSSAAIYHCSECPRTYVKPSLLLKHQLVFHNQKKKKKGPPMLKGKKRRLRCKMCPKLFVSQTKLLIHMKKHPQQSQAQSPVKKTKKTGSGAGRGRGRACTATNGTYSCEYCSKWFSSRPVYQTHLVAIHSLEVYKKSLPEGTTEHQLNNVIKTAFAEHIKYPRDESRKIYGCPYCFHRYPHPSHLRLHIIRGHFNILADRIFEGQGLDETPEDENGYDEMSGEGYEIELENGNMDIDDEEGSMFHLEFENEGGDADAEVPRVVDQVEVGEHGLVMGEVENHHEGDDDEDYDDQPPILMRQTYSLSDNIDNAIGQEGKDEAEAVDSIPIPIVRNEEVF